MTNNSHASRCLLSSECKLANSAECKSTCPHFIAIHGKSGAGGRAAAAGVPADYRLVTVANSPARESQTNVYKNVYAYIATFERQFNEGERVKSLYLKSESPGTGKTTTAAAILNEWLTVHYLGSIQRGLQPAQRPAYFLDVNEWQTDYNQFNRARVPDVIAEAASKRYYLAMERAKHAPFAVLDDLGVRGSTDGFRSDLHAVVNHRVTNQMPTVYTSNLPIFYTGKRVEGDTEPYDLVDVFGEERLPDRINEQCGVQTFVGESKRGLRR
ncbi:DNA replication protein [Cytobacillus purgationiresistens]|uniref:DNA replication protein DnaC n=1 Tax=Cytobacillus purgationiresistens TaxID=863449 RepID=A0ABU0AHQ9_9BACI|nr:DNA replication protein [Cytobacillus purgationiresistens]MDQ0270789.1 DNA replication protein DnaC [Cytobacillus purgationiresistens]